jgi:hypothetical protein
MSYKLLGKVFRKDFSKYKRYGRGAPLMAKTLAEVVAELHNDDHGYGWGSQEFMRQMAEFGKTDTVRKYLGILEAEGLVAHDTDEKNAVTAIVESALDAMPDIPSIRKRADRKEEKRAMAERVKQPTQAKKKQAKRKPYDPNKYLPSRPRGNADPNRRLPPRPAEKETVNYETY